MSTVVLTRCERCEWSTTDAGDDWHCFQLREGSRCVDPGGGKDSPEGVGDICPDCVEALRRFWNADKPERLDVACPVCEEKGHVFREPSKLTGYGKPLVFCQACTYRWREGDA
jgi:hypothetical protein